MCGLAYFKVITVQEITLLALGTGLAMSLNTPSYQALVPQLIPREDLTNAIALNSAQFNMSRVIGPTLGGFAMALVGVAGNSSSTGSAFWLYCSRSRACVIPHVKRSRKAISGTSSNRASATFSRTPLWRLWCC